MRVNGHLRDAHRVDKVAKVTFTSTNFGLKKEIVTTPQWAPTAKGSQPFYLGPRGDVPEAECLTSQLKYKPVA